MATAHIQPSYCWRYFSFLRTLSTPWFKFWWLSIEMYAAALNILWTPHLLMRCEFIAHYWFVWNTFSNNCCQNTNNLPYFACFDWHQILFRDKGCAMLKLRFCERFWGDIWAARYDLLTKMLSKESSLLAVGQPKMGSKMGLKRHFFSTIVERVPMNIQLIPAH